MRQLQAKNKVLDPPEAGGSKEGPSSNPSEGAQTCGHLDLRLLVSEMNVILSCPRYVNFLGSPRKLIGCQSCRSNR